MKQVDTSLSNRVRALLTSQHHPKTPQLWRHLSSEISPGFSVLKAPQVGRFPKSEVYLEAQRDSTEKGLLVFEGKEIFLPTHQEKVLQKHFEAVKLPSWEFLPRFEFFLLKRKRVFLWPWHHTVGLLTHQKDSQLTLKEVHRIAIMLPCCSIHETYSSLESNCSTPLRIRQE